MESNIYCGNNNLNTDITFIYGFLSIDSKTLIITNSNK